MGSEILLCRVLGVRRGALANFFMGQLRIKRSFTHAIQQKTYPAARLVRP